MKDIVIDINLHNLELNVLAYRYLYYVLAQSPVPDAYYDVLEKKAREVLPATSDVHKVGSSLPYSYSQEVIDYAKRMINYVD